MCVCVWCYVPTLNFVLVGVNCIVQSIYTFKNYPRHKIGHVKLKHVQNPEKLDEGTRLKQILLKKYLAYLVAMIFMNHYIDVLISLFSATEFLKSTWSTIFSKVAGF